MLRNTDAAIGIHFHGGMRRVLLIASWRADNQGFPYNGFSLIPHRPQPSGPPAIMNHLFFFWSALRTVQQAYTRHANNQEQRAVEAYLSGAQTASELESRERQWLRAHS